MNRKMIAVLAFGLLAVAGAYAAIQGATVTTGRSDTMTATTAGNDTAEGGYVTMINLTATMSTDRWQGYYGNVTGDLQLGYSTNVFYDFSGATALSVFASRNQSFDFASLEAAAAADVDTVWGYAIGNDQAADVFTGSRNIGGVVVPTAALEPTGPNRWFSGIFDDGSSTAKGYFAFGTNVTDGSVAGFDGNGWHYQLMVPADGTEMYFFFLEI